MSAATPGTDAAPPLAGIVPRWEWRTFGERFGDADARLGELTPENVRESDEVYLLSLDSDASVKVRDGLMDVKQLERVDDEGLEQWRPVLKASFPLPAADVARLLSALGVASPPPARASYSFDELVDEVVRGSDDLLAVDVHKERRHYRPGGCMVELTELRTGSGSTRTIAVESEDAGLVARTVRDLGLDSRPNVCMARGLKTLVGFEAIRYAVLDVGTNSIKFHIGEHRPNGAWRTIADRAEITRLGEGLDEAGGLRPEPILRTVEAIVAMVDEARRNGVAAIAAVGTAGLRIASNAAHLIDAVRERSGVGIEVISGEEEARLAYLAATSALALRDSALVVFDTGGGSSQFTVGHGTHIDEQFSVNVGAARLTERYGLGGVVSEDVVREAQAAIAAEFTRLDKIASPDALVGIGGAVTNLAAVKHELAAYDPEIVQGTVLDAGEVDRQIELYRTRTAGERRGIVGLQPKRAEVILAGACVVRTVLTKLRRDSLVVSDRGLRHGLLAERFG
jgi:exopolyphosphatase / guanosine-5'-triphosphate,3'-diphosphate pyrophosphatase